MSGARLLSIIKKHIVSETEEMNLETIIGTIIPQIINKNLPLDRYEKEREEIFYLLNEILFNKNFSSSQVTEQLIFGTMLSFASSNEQMNQILSWYNKTIESPVTLSTVHMHTMIKKIWASS